MAVHAVLSEPVSTGEFPANRENNREFHKIGPLNRRFQALSHPQIQWPKKKIP